MLVALTSVLNERSFEDRANVVRAAMAATAQFLDKRLLFTVPFSGETVKVCSVNGQYVRTPTDAPEPGMGIIDFTMGGNWYAGDPPGIYRPICAEDEVVIHNLLSPVDTLATVVHELSERWAMKYFGVGYDVAHTFVASVIEKWLRVATSTWHPSVRDALARRVAA